MAFGHGQPLRCGMSGHGRDETQWQTRRNTHVARPASAPAHASLLGRRCGHRTSGTAPATATELSLAPDILNSLQAGWRNGRAAAGLSQGSRMGTEGGRQKRAACRLLRLSPQRGSAPAGRPGHCQDAGRAPGRPGGRAEGVRGHGLARRRHDAGQRCPLRWQPAAGAGPAPEVQVCVKTWGW